MEGYDGIEGQITDTVVQIYNNVASQCWSNERMIQPNDGKMLVNDGDMLVNDGELSI